MNVLNELYMRMAQAAPIQRQRIDMGRVETLPSVPGSGRAWETEPHAQPPAQSQPILQGQSKSPSVVNSLPTDFVGNNNSIRPPGSTGKKWGIPFKSRSPRGSSSTPRPDPNPSKQYNPPNEPSAGKASLGIQAGGNAPSTWDPSSRAPVRKSSTHDSQLERPHSGSWKPSPEMRIDEDNPWREETSASPIRDVVPDSPDPKETQRFLPGPQRRSTEQTFVDDEGLKSAHISSPSGSQTRLVLNRTPSIESKATSLESKATPGKFTSMFRRRTSTEATQVAEKAPPLKRLDNSRKPSPAVSRAPSIPQPAPSTSKDPCGGFCKGAYKLQVGLVKESMKISNQSTSMTGQSNYWACASSKCCFEGAACRVGNKAWEFDNTVRTLQGTRYRWTLLAKSHVAMSKVMHHNYDFQCIFCAEQGQPAIIYRGNQAFLDHISTHRGQSASLLNSEKIICKTGRVALDHEVFDVNFPPSGETPQYHGRTLVNSPDIDIKMISPEEEEGFIWSNPEPPFDPSPWKQQT